MQTDTAALSFCPVIADDLLMLDTWMARPHWHQWWGDPDTELGYVRDMIAGRDTPGRFVIMLDGTLSDYVRYWFIDHHQNDHQAGQYSGTAEMAYQHKATETI